MSHRDLAEKGDAMLIIRPPGQGSPSRVPRTNRVPDAEERDEGDLMWQAHELETCGPHYMGVLTAAPGDPHLGDKLPVDAVQNEILEQLKCNDKIGAGDHWQRQEGEATRDSDERFQMGCAYLSGTNERLGREEGGGQFDIAG